MPKIKHIEKLARVIFFPIDDPLFNQIPQGAALKDRCKQYPECFVWLRILPSPTETPEVHYADNEESIREQYRASACHIYIVQVPFSQRRKYPYWKAYEELGNP